jgi:signal transduction histidine kinase
MIAPVRLRGILPYGFAAVSVAAAWAIRAFFDPVLGEHASYIFFSLSVALAAWLGGIWPALFATALSCLAGEYFFTHPKGSIRITSLEELLSLLTFAIVGVVIGVLSEASLRALERAKAAERAKDAFLATLAHELRSPLSVIQYANELNRISGNNKSDDHVEIIERQVQQLDLMIQDLLDISRITRGTMRLDCRHVDATQIVDGAVLKAKPLFIDRDHVLNVDVAEGPIPIYADPVRMEQVLANLLINAAKYTPDGGKIDVRVEADGDLAVFRVRDNGIGIAPEAISQVFELFMQAEPGSTYSAGGLGIGLALVRKVVELHGGNVHATSAGKGRGSEFTVSLPLDLPADAAPASEDLASSAIV